jgi:hypothetical protein
MVQTGEVQIWLRADVQAFPMASTRLPGIWNRLTGRDIRERAPIHRFTGANLITSTTHTERTD